MIIYEFLKIILTNEFKSICQHINTSEMDTINLNKNKQKKIRKKNITIEIVNN